MTNTFLNSTFTSRESLMNFLTYEKNSYSEFILIQLAQKETFINFKKHKHHIQPKHSNGSDQSWNLILLSPEQYAKAHKLLFECYGNYYDKCAWHMLLKQKTEGFRALKRQNLIKMKQNNKGFYNSDLQKELAKRPRKKRRPYTRSPWIKQALINGFILEYIKTGEIIVIQPNKYESFRQFFEIWVEHPTLIQHKKIWTNTGQKSNYFLYSNFLRCLSGHVDLKTKKSIYTFQGWCVKGIFLPNTIID